jgi:integrase
LTETTARKILDDILESTGARALPHDTVRAFAARWLASKELGITAGTIQRYSQVVAAFLESLGPLADRSLQAVTSVHIASYRDERLRTDHISRGTLSRDLSVLSGLFSAARREALILINPVEGVGLPVSKPLEREIFTVEELGALLVVAPPEWRTLILCGYFLAGRLVDMARLTWANIDLAAGLVTYVQGKTARKVIVPLHPQLEEHLLALAASDSGGALCPALSKLGTAGRSGLSNQFSRLMDKAGVDRHQIQLGANNMARKSYHCLRHSFTSALANAGVPAEVRMKLTGHVTSSSHRTYTHHELAPLKAAILMLPSV